MSSGLGFELEITVTGDKGIPFTFSKIKNGVLPLKKVRKLFLKASGLSFKKNGKQYPILPDDDDDTLELEQGINEYEVLMSQSHLTQVDKYK